jgi:hypothetical protein
MKISCEHREEKGSIWLEASPDLNTAENRINELISFWPGEYRILDQQTHQTVAKRVRPTGPKNEVPGAPESIRRKSKTTQELGTTRYTIRR